MSEQDVATSLVKAEESIKGAASECANDRFNNCANRAYYACFQAAVAALMREGINPPAQSKRWGHEFVQARFVGDLINRRRRYPATLRDTLFRGMELRQTADYRTDHVAAIRATRALARAQAFVDAIQARGVHRT
jgi:uncharacterized protein (UPF0332 family)